MTMPKKSRATEHPRYIDKLANIKYDAEGLHRKTQYRDSTVRPWIVILLLTSALIAVPFCVINAVRVYTSFGGGLIVAIVYTVLMGIVVGGFSILDAAYALGYSGLPTYDELPLGVYEFLRRYSTHSYIRPYMYHDDRVPRNNAGIWKLRILVPMTYAMSVLVYWGVESRDASVYAMHCVFGNVLLAFLAFLQIKVIISNVYTVYAKWDFVPYRLERGKQ